MEESTGMSKKIINHYQNLEPESASSVFFAHASHETGEGESVLLRFRFNSGGLYK